MIDRKNACCNFTSHSLLECIFLCDLYKGMMEGMIEIIIKARVRNGVIFGLNGIFYNISFKFAYHLHNRMRILTNKTFCVFGWAKRSGHFK